MSEISIHQQVTVLVYYKLRAEISFPFYVHRLELLMETSLIAFTDACFEVTDWTQQMFSTVAMRTPSRYFLKPPLRRLEECQCCLHKNSSDLLFVAMLSLFQFARQCPQTNPVVQPGSLKALTFQTK